jgi:hypothetical protein
MSQSKESENRALVHEALDNKCDYPGRLGRGGIRK